MTRNRFATYAWGVLAYNVVVILWGAYVRATGSGAGCDRYWPTCQGQIIPRAPEVETLIEFSHRLSSGLALLLVIGLLIWAFRAYPKGHTVRRGAVFSMVFIIIEALIGAGLVLFQLVAYNDSLARVYAISAHLLNTFFLLATLTLTAWWASGGRPIAWQGQNRVRWALAAALLGVAILGVSGAITALGDTLFPLQSLAEEFAQDFSPQAHFLKRLRVWHPATAMLVGLYLFLTAGVFNHLRYGLTAKRFAQALLGLFMAQLGVGVVNVLLKAPIWLQLVHLLMADLVWIALVLLAASALEEKTAYQRPRS